MAAKKPDKKQDINNCTPTNPNAPVIGWVGQQICDFYNKNNLTAGRDSTTPIANNIKQATDNLTKAAQNLTKSAADTSKGVAETTKVGADFGWIMPIALIALVILVLKK